MAKRKRNAEDTGTKVDPLKRLADIAAMLLVKGEKQEEKIRVLAGVGYAASEIAELVGTTPQTVRQTLYTQRKKKK